MESVFKDQTLCSTLAEKQKKVDTISEKRDSIVKYEKEFDKFVDLGHVLLRISGVERLKPLVTQLSNRYQQLHITSKEANGKWCGISADHKAYDAKSKEINTWLDSLSKKISLLSKEKDSVSIQSTLNHLQGEREQGNHRLVSITSLGERLYPYTASQGRDKIRLEIKKLREKWEDIERKLNEQQRIQDAKAQQNTVLQDNIASAKTWLETIEKMAPTEPTNWLSIQEIRSRIIKQKVCCFLISLNLLLLILYSTSFIDGLITFGIRYHDSTEYMTKIVLEY